MARAFKLTNDTLLLSTEAPGGIYNSAQLKKIAALCDAEGAIVKATEDQRLALFVPVAKAQEISKQLQGVGIGIRHYQDGLHQPTNCIGALCPDHLQDAMGSALDVTETLATTKLDASCKIGINGCARCCVPTHTLDISVVGDTNGYRISLGGKNSQIPEMASFMAEGVPAGELPKLLNKVVGIYKKLAQPEESMQDVIERCGSKEFISALAPYSQDAHQGDDPFASGEEIAAPAEFTEPAESTDGLGDDLSAFGDEDESMSTVKATDFGSDAGSFSDDLNPQDELALENDGLDIDPGDFSDSAMLEDDVAIAPVSKSAPAVTPTPIDEMALGESDDLLADDLQADDLQASDLEAEELQSGELESNELTAMDDPGSLVDEELLMADDLVAEETPVMEDSIDNLDETVVEDTMLEDVALEETAGDTVLEDSSLEEEMALEEPVVEDVSLDDMALDATSLDTTSLDESSLDETSTDEMTLGEVASAPQTPETPAPKAAPAVAAAVADESGDDMALAEEINEADADAFEAKLEESIAEEESVPQSEDANAGARLEAMEFLESSSEEAGLDDSDVVVSEDFGSDFEEDASIMSSESEIAEEQSGDQGNEQVFGDLGIDQDSFETIPDDVDLDDDELAKAEAAVVARSVAPAAAAPAAAPVMVGSFGKASSGQALSGFDVDAQGRLMLRFASNMTMAIDPQAVPPGGRRELTACGQKIVLSHSSAGLSIEIDGVSFMLPQRAA